MDSKAKVNSGNGRLTAHGSPEAAVKPSTFARDAIDLCELQFKLLVTDLQETMKDARTGTMTLLVATGLLVAAAPLYLAALAAWLVSQFELSWAVSLLITAVVASIISGILFAIGWSIIRRGTANLDRSRQEFRENLEWAKQMLSPKN